MPRTERCVLAILLRGVELLGQGGCAPWLRDGRTLALSRHAWMCTHAGGDAGGRTAVRVPTPQFGLRVVQVPKPGCAAQALGEMKCPCQEAALVDPLGVLRGGLRVQPLQNQQIKKVHAPMAACMRTPARQCANMLLGLPAARQ